MRGRGNSMLTRKQQWRRVRLGARRAPETSSSSSAKTTEAAQAGIKSNSMPHHPTSCLRGSNGCLTQRRDARSPSKKAEGASGARVRFDLQVRVILVPCAKELRVVKSDIWWTDSDFAKFKHEYVLFMRAAAQRRQEEQRRRYIEEANAASTPAPAGSKVAAMGPTTSLVAENDDTLPPSPPSPLSSTTHAAAVPPAPPAPSTSSRRSAISCIIQVSDIFPAASAAAAAVTAAEVPAAFETGDAKDQASGTRLSSLISREALTSAAAAAMAGEAATPPMSPPPSLAPSTSGASEEGALVERRDKIAEGDKAVFTLSPPPPTPRWPFLWGFGWRSAAPAPALGAVTKWTAAAGAAAARAAADEDEDGYRTQSMSSASDSSSDDDDDWQSCCSDW